jgi:cytochrome c oxidase subunit 4
MAETPDLTSYTVHDQDMAQELEVESHAPYMKVWAILAVLTLIEYFYAMIFKDHFPLLVTGLVCLALVKAGMVGWYFMHLKFERKWVYILIIPACVMAIFLTLMLAPDMAMKPVTEENPGEEETSYAPADRAVPAPIAHLALWRGPSAAACPERRG